MFVVIGLRERVLRLSRFRIRTQYTDSVQSSGPRASLDSQSSTC